MPEPHDPFETYDRPPATPEWFVTFADMMSLLLAMFVMLASFSEIREEERFRAMSDALHGQFGQAIPARTQDETIHSRDLRWATQIDAARAHRARLLRDELQLR